MKSKLNAYAVSVIFCLNILIIFLLIFEQQLEIPQWLQPIGRMHPMLLHFPIVLLILAAGLEFFRFKPVNKEISFYYNFTTGLFLSGILLSGITVLMGLFLSLEDGYEGDTLIYHKWFGVSTVFLSSVLYKLRDFKWYNEISAKAGSITLALILIVAGHFGAVLTHGDNFVLEPISKPIPVPLDQARVYDHVIQPIFQEKCVSCHNDQKLKGSLKLTDSLSILKGGKTGKLFIAGKPNLSLLLERIHLPSTVKKHMPPSGKPQLTDEESELLFLWIKGNASFSKKVMDLDQNDSLRVLATSRLKPAEIQEEGFDFDAADDETIKKLNTFYRLVAPVSQGSPALAVSFFSKSGFDSKSLDELTAIKDQIISLRLSRMPVKDADLSKISKFKSLQNLDLNFTDITGSGLKELSGLKFLKSLSLSGTQVNLKQVQPVIALKSLEELTIWNTSFSAKDIQELKRLNKNLKIITGFKDDGTTLIRLSQPLLKNSSRVFKDQSAIELSHPRQGVTIRYTLDGTEPDSLTSAVFKNDLNIKMNATIKAKAYKKGWLSSEVSTFGFLRTAIKPDMINLLFVPNEYHKAAGAKSLIDGQLGDFDTNNNNWLGFQENNLEVLLEFKTVRKIENIALNTLISSNGSAFPPTSIQIYGGTDKNNLNLIATLNPEMPVKTSQQEIKTIYTSFKPQTVSHLKIIAKPLRKLPVWHQAKGKPALLLVDEVLVN
ncbi:Uncharacterized membrane protein [Daejeonella rubra]|uniref:Uncharacterized membrane protein n=1 Tax=Daejeonella rubra TaxID=990371 RepID=A0A1G9S3L3_9SPHI|nr:chitobiase/beta-hexosaminidase C-terminal domain-containing protein [Daejeonella rubra]SDM29335.1 Uncharacterized membrane protein [Daejeonella rubra]